MAQTMTASVVEASGITDGQIDNMVDKLRAAVRKHRSEITTEVAQQVLGVENLGMEMFAVIRKHAEMMSNIIVRHAKVDRTRTPQAMLDATGRNKYVTDSVVAAMPKGDGEEVDVSFFKLGRYVSDVDLDKEYELRGLIPADPYSQGAVNEADPVFADDHPNGTHWKDTKGKWCCAAFGRWRGGRGVVVDRDDGGWYDGWWFAGLRK